MKMRLIAFICALIAGFLLVSAMSTKAVNKAEAKPADVLTVFLTGNELGTMQPCGCSGGQLGGLDRRSAVFNGAEASKRMIVDTGGLVDGDGKQDLIKFNIIIQAFGLLDYDLVNLTEKDFQATKNLGLLVGIGSVFDIISSYNSTDANIPTTFTKQFSLDGAAVAVTVATLDTESEAINQIGRLFPPAVSDMQSVKIVILNRNDTAAIDRITKMAGVDCFVVPAESDEPEIIGDPDQRPLVISVGRLGKYVGRLQITTAEAKNKLNFDFSAVPVAEDFPQQKPLVELYETYQQLVKEAGILENQPRFTLPDGLKYTGSKSCIDCHEYEYEKWSSHGHAHAYATLKRVGSQFDPECVSCHVVGMEYQGGFVSPQKTANLKNVGCENCHGPGSEHIKASGEIPIIEPKSSCIDCHTPERSANYAGNEQDYLEKIIHWREPKAGSNVK